MEIFAFGIHSYMRQLVDRKYLGIIISLGKSYMDILMSMSFQFVSGALVARFVKFWPAGLVILCSVPPAGKNLF